MLLKDTFTYFLIFMLIYVALAIFLTRLDHKEPTHNRFNRPHMYLEEQHRNEPACTPRTSILLAKTHKTAGSTLSCIIARFGFERNLEFALPSEGYILGYTMFTRDMLLQQPKNAGFDFLLNHVRFNKTAMKEVMKPEAKYVTILREPIAHFHSVLKYYSLKELSTRDDPEEERNKEIDLPTLFKKIKTCSYFSCLLGKNGQFFDLGVSDGEHFKNEILTRQKIERLDKEFDLVLITEYFDESLLLLKKMMCWRFEDILYIPKKQSIDKNVASFTSEEQATIRAENAGDAMLYDYFNRTLWRKIKEYGPNFDEDLKYFRRMNRRTIESCVDFTSVRKLGMAFNYELRNNSFFCQVLNADIAQYTMYIAQQVRERQNKVNGTQQ